jgi:hypothetical protein
MLCCNRGVKNKGELKCGTVWNPVGNKSKKDNAVNI